MSRFIVIKLIMAFFILSWFFFPSTIINGTYSKIYQDVSPDKKYTVVIYYSKIMSPMSFYKYMKNEDHFFILYDSSGNEVFKPSPYYGTSEIAAYDSIRFVYTDKHYLFFPSAEGYDSFELLR
ncbi:DUF6201 family protein [Raoultella terrigena]|uniref:DUF6201 family protein n=1 Tax=Raoultella terrigena TaxID=577 RepID=UPI0039DF57AC